MTRDTESYIGDSASSTPPSVGNAGTVINATGLSLDAENTGNLLGVSVAGAVIDSDLADKASTGKAVDGSTNSGSATGNQPGSTGTPGITKPASTVLPLAVGIAGAVGINEVTDTAESYINDNGAIDLAQGDLTLTSENDTRILAVTGSVSLAALI